MTEPDAVFHLDGDLAIPTELTRGPWSPHAQHGGAPAALLAGLLERFDPGPADFTARLAVDLMRPVPLSPLRIERRTTRPGKKVQIVEGSLFDGDTEVVRATALRIRSVDPPFEDHGTGGETQAEAVPPPGASFILGADVERPLGFWDAIDVSTAIGEFGVPSERNVVWFRLRVPVIAGESPSPLQRVAAAADFGNGIAIAIDRNRFSFINPDVTVTLHRAPVGKWVALDSRGFVEAHGVGLAESVLHDERGRIGRSVQTVIVDEWPGGRPDGLGVRS